MSYVKGWQKSSGSICTKAAAPDNAHRRRGVLALLVHAAGHAARERTSREYISIQETLEKRKIHVEEKDESVSITPAKPVLLAAATFRVGRGDGAKGGRACPLRTCISYRQHARSQSNTHATPPPSPSSLELNAENENIVNLSHHIPPQMCGMGTERGACCTLWVNANPSQRQQGWLKCRVGVSATAFNRKKQSPEPFAQY